MSDRAKIDYDAKVEQFVRNAISKPPSLGIPDSAYLSLIAIIDRLRAQAEEARKVAAVVVAELADAQTENAELGRLVDQLRAPPARPAV